MPKKLSEAHNNKAQQKKKNELEKKVHQKRVKNGYGCSFGYFMSLIKVKTMKHRKPYNEDSLPDNCMLYHKQVC